MNDMPANSNASPPRCPVCGAAEFAHRPVLWPELIEAWQLSARETNYVNRQQGTHCVKCGNNLRAMALAAAVMDTYDQTHSTLVEFCDAGDSMRVLEINRAANLTPIFQRMPGHRLVEYPEFDMEALDIESASFELVVHSDTLEHVRDPARGLRECRRVLKPGGACIFTIPIIVDRMSRRRDGLPSSYHGGPGVSCGDQIVHTEFGADFWKTVAEAGFRHCAIHAFEYPAALAVIARD